MTVRTPEKRAMHAAYMRRRTKALREGTWTPRRTAEATATPSETQIAWAAGFLEGDGHFRSSEESGSPIANAVQKDREPLDKLLAYFGGSITEFTHTTSRKKYLRWNVCGRKARYCMALVLPHIVSTRRKEQIERAMK
jgi:hypothetical protein